MPLAHILLPQLARKAQEIEAALGHAPSTASYLGNGDASVGSGPLPKPGTKYAPGQSPAELAAAEYQTTKAAPEQAKSAGQVMANSARKSAALASKKAQYLQPVPNAPVAQPTAPQKGKKVLSAPAGQAIGVNERGESIDARGRSLGYLQQPELVTPYGNTPLQAPVRTDAAIAPQPGIAYRFAQPNDTFAPAAFERLYGEHLKAMENNRDANGMPTDKFPSDYFQALGKQRGKPLSKNEIDAIKKGVEELRAMQNGTRI